MNNLEKRDDDGVGLFAHRLCGARRRVPWRRCFEACFNKRGGVGEAYLSLAAFGSDLRDHMIANNGSPAGFRGAHSLPYLAFCGANEYLFLDEIACPLACLTPLPALRWSKLAACGAMEN